MLYKKKYDIIISTINAATRADALQRLQFPFKNGGSLNMKKIIALFCVIAIMLGMGLSAFAAADSRGNCDGSVGGEIDISDAMLLFYYVAKKPDSDFPAFNDNYDYAKLRQILGID